MKKRYTEEQIIKAIKQHEAGAKVDDICFDLPSYATKIIFSVVVSGSTKDVLATVLPSPLSFAVKIICVSLNRYFFIMTS